jgi:hypothetical protein
VAKQPVVEVQNSPAPEPLPVKKSVAPLKPIASLKSLEDLKKEVEEEERRRADTQSTLNEETLQACWMAYAAQCSSPSTRLLLEQFLPVLQGSTLLVTVGTQLAKNALIQESALLEYIREQTHSHGLLLQVEVDPALNKEKDVVARPVSTADKYQHLLSKNPLLEKLIQTLHLKPDE